MKSINYSTNRFWNRIAEQLSPILNGHELLEWIENIGDSLYVDSFQNSIAVDLKKYYPLTNIEKRIYRKDLSVKARLVQNESSFIIELKDFGSENNIRLQKYLVAHEIAHTFFYNTSSKPFRDYKLFSYGNKELEFICNRIARSVLLPRCIIKGEVITIHTPNHDNFSLNHVKELSKSFNVTRDVLLNRLITDTSIWNCLLIKFTLHQELKVEKKKKEKNILKWRIKRDYLPYQYWGNIKAFIPKKSISAKGKVENLINSVYDELISIIPQENVHYQKKFLSKSIKKELLLDDPLKNFINYHFKDNEEILVHFSASSYKTFDLCIPLP